jgi:hypothetical protein
LPGLGMGLRHVGEVIDQDVEDFCIGFVGILAPQFGEELVQLLLGFGIGFWSVVILNPNLIACDGDISGIDIANLIDIEDGLVLRLLRHGLRRLGLMNNDKGIYDGEANIGI